ncbi:MAG: helix-turn-helix transcriptional regulator [Acidimicrobiaceae bacterium]|nr:helix-turn-helix transcriptional regulator [Acidimicrobiaceae bacterium]
MTQRLNDIKGVTSCGRLGQAVRMARHARGMTQAELSVAAGVSRPQISIIESGRANPGMVTVMRLLRALDCSLTVVPADPEQFSLSAHLSQHRPPHGSS